MKTLVLAVDRDDDLGQKVGIEGPVIGRADMLDAAMKFALADPEDTDMNSMFSAIRYFDDLLKRGIEAEVALITGDPEVGFKSDQVLNTQIDMVLEKVKPESVVLVSDGAEDEYIYPMISSRVKIDSVRKVYVRQNQSIEGTYYLITRALKDVKLRAKIIAPIALILIMYGLVDLSPRLYKISTGATGIESLSAMGPGAISITVGIYLVGWAYQVVKHTKDLLAKASRAAQRGSVFIPFVFVSVIFLVLGILFGLDSLSIKSASISEDIVLLISAMVWPWVFSVFFFELGKTINDYIHHSGIRMDLVVMIISVFALGFIIQGALDAVEYFTSSSDINPFIIVLEITTGILIAVFGAVMSSTIFPAGSEEEKQVSS